MGFLKSDRVRATYAFGLLLRTTLVCIFVSFNHVGDVSQFLANPFDISGATGSLFTAPRTRTYEKDRSIITSDFAMPVSDCKLEKWAVVTSINYVSEAVIRANRLEEWCVVFVADDKTPSEELQPQTIIKSSSFIYLSMKEQTGIRNAFVEGIPHNHFGRKNIGYMFAIYHGAEVIFDFDDDNQLLLTGSVNSSDIVFEPFASDSFRSLDRFDCNNSVINPYPLMGASINDAWPRGFPYPALSNAFDVDGHYSKKCFQKENMGVIQLVANVDPDVDAIFRLTHRKPGFSFDANLIPLRVPRGVYAPYNAQATVHYKSAFWALLLPITVHGRVSDIWRGYFAQRLFHLYDIPLTFAPPRVEQIRNEHHFLADLQSEIPLYLQAQELLRVLDEWTPKVDQSFPEQLLDLWIELYERGFIELEDIHQLRKWLGALVSMGYKFPVTPATELAVISHKDLGSPPKLFEGVQLIGKINYPDNWEVAHPFVKTWEKYFSKVIVCGPFSGEAERALNKSGIHTIQSAEDQGYISPYVCLRDAILEAEATNKLPQRGYMMFHDDLVLNISQISTVFDLARPAGGSRSWPCGAVAPDTFSGWGWWENTPVGRVAYDKLLQDEQLPEEQRKALRAQVCFGDSDFAYVPTSQATKYVQAAGLFSRNGVFLEIAIPTIMKVLMENVALLPLCTSWNHDRSLPLKMIANCENASIVHPVKHSHEDHSKAVQILLEDNISC